jgi:hypothetical protein
VCLRDCNLIVGPGQPTRRCPSNMWSFDAKRQKLVRKRKRPALQFPSKTTSTAYGARTPAWAAQVLAVTSQLDGITDPTAIPPRMRGYNYSGSLRPAHTTPQVSVDSVPAHVLRTDYANDPDGIAHSEVKATYTPGKKTIDVRTEAELTGFRHACRCGREVLDTASKFLKAGVTGDEIDRIVHATTVEMGGYPSPLNYYKFPKSVCISPNEVICHGIPDCRPIESGDIVNLDVTIFINGYHADLNETYLVGDCDDGSIHLVKTAYECLAAACRTIKPGTLYRSLGTPISQLASARGCSVVRGTRRILTLHAPYTCSPYSPFTLTHTLPPLIRCVATAAMGSARSSMLLPSCPTTQRTKL